MNSVASVVCLVLLLFGPLAPSWEIHSPGPDGLYHVTLQEMEELRRSLQDFQAFQTSQLAGSTFGPPRWLLLACLISVIIYTVSWSIVHCLQIWDWLHSPKEVKRKGQ